MPLLFSYGTLQDPAVQRANFGRELEGRADALTGYARQEAETPGVVETDVDADEVPGTVFDLTEDELAATDKRHAGVQHRILLSLASGVRAWVYVS
ncbi:gamma-glutamylcyclotransferase family protein [Actinoplanes sp. NPDC051851]|uniref:gamma-glutamylcyclotransferase family protein n=1 Tax=Actinoplanes sp. NPDC051851 TaxID=3154753 RepID=UPI003427BFA2